MCHQKIILSKKIKRYHFVEGHALNDKPLLAEVAVDEITKLVSAAEKRTDTSFPTLMTVSEILDFLDGDEGTSEIHDALQQLHKLGEHVCG